MTLLKTCCDFAAAWLSLDPNDNHPASFWTYLIAALQTAAPGVGAGALSLLQAPQPPPIETVLATLQANGLPTLEGTWHYIGPFDNRNPEDFDIVYPPEKGIDLTKTHAEIPVE